MAAPKSPNSVPVEQQRAELFSTSLSNDVRDFGNYAKEYFNLGEEEAQKNLEQANPQPSTVKVAKKFDEKVKGYFADKIKNLSEQTEPSALVRKELIWSQFYQDYLNTKDRDPRLAYENAKAKLLKDPEFKNDRSLHLELANRVELMKPKAKKGTYKGEFQQSNDLLFTYRNTSWVRMMRVLKDKEVRKLVEGSLSNLVQEHLSLVHNSRLSGKLKENSQDTSISTDLEIASVMNRSSHNPALDLAYKDSADWGSRALEAETNVKTEFNKYSNYYLPKNDEESTRKFSEFLEEKRKEVRNSPHEASPTEIVDWIRSGIKDSTLDPQTNSVKKLGLIFSKKLKENEAYLEKAEAINSILKKIKEIGKEASVFNLKTGTELLTFAYSKFLPIKDDDQAQHSSIGKECRLLLNGKSSATVEMAISEIMTKRYFRDVRMMLSKELGQLNAQVNKQVFSKGIKAEQGKSIGLKNKISANSPNYSYPDSLNRRN